MNNPGYDFDLSYQRAERFPSRTQKREILPSYCDIETPIDGRAPPWLPEVVDGSLSSEHKYCYLLTLPLLQITRSALILERRATEPEDGTERHNRAM